MPHLDMQSETAVSSPNITWWHHLVSVDKCGDSAGAGRHSNAFEPLNISLLEPKTSLIPTRCLEIVTCTKFGDRILSVVFLLIMRNNVNDYTQTDATVQLGLRSTSWTWIIGT